MKYVKTDDLRHYDIEYDDVGGTLEKFFLRIDNAKLSEYIEEAIKPNCAYVSYIDEFVRENYRDGHLPLKYLSVLFKRQRFTGYRLPEETYKEEIGSRLAYSMGIPTVYNKAIRLQDEEFTMSLDFVKPGYEIISLPENEEVDDLAEFKAWEEYILEFIDENYPKLPMRQTQINQIMDEFVLQFLLKKYIFQDIDFATRNISFVWNDDAKSLELAPCHDYEYILNGGVTSRAYLNMALKDLKYVKSKYPEALQRFGEGLKKYIDKSERVKFSKISGILRKCTSDEYLKRKCQEQLENNFKMCNMSYNFCMAMDLSEGEDKDNELLV